MIFIHKTPVVENHPTTREIRELLRPTDGKRVLFLDEQIAGNTGNKDKASNIVSDEDIMENNNMFVILSNLSAVSRLIFPQCFFSISGANSKNNLRGYVTF